MYFSTYFPNFYDNYYDLLQKDVSNMSQLIDKSERQSLQMSSLSGPKLGVRDITGIQVYPNLAVLRYVSHYAFDQTGTLGKHRQFSQHSSSAFVLSCILFAYQFLFNLA